jgi:hypothetical protein
VKNNKQLLAVEQKLNKASKSVAKELEKDTSSLSNIQASRLELERQVCDIVLYTQYVGFVNAVHDATCVTAERVADGTSRRTD